MYRGVRGLSEGGVVWIASRCQLGSPRLPPRGLGARKTQTHRQIPDDNPTNLGKHPKVPTPPQPPNGAPNPLQNRQHLLRIPRFRDPLLPPRPKERILLIRMGVHNRSSTEVPLPLPRTILLLPPRRSRRRISPRLCAQLLHPLLLPLAPLETNPLIRLCNRNVQQPIQ